MSQKSENLRQAKEHFLNSQKEFLLSLLYLCRYIKEHFEANGRAHSPIAYLADAGEMFVNSLLLLIPFDGKGGLELREDARVLLRAIENIEREYMRSGVSFEPGSLEYRMLDLLKRAAEMLAGEVANETRRRARKKVTVK